MGIVGIKFRENFIFVPEVLACARAMKAGMAHIEPILSASGIEPIGKVVMGTVKGDLHDIGKNLCIMMLRGAGFEVIDLGVDTSPDDFIDAVEEHQPERARACRRCSRRRCRTWARPSRRSSTPACATP